MAVKGKSLFLYGYEIDGTNFKLPFQTVATDAEYIAELRQGQYSLTGLLNEIERAMAAVDFFNSFFASATRTNNGGTENRVIIESTSSYLTLNFLSSPVASDSCYAQIGFLASDYTGQTLYTSPCDTGTKVFSEYAPYNYLPKEMFEQQQGALSISSYGLKEAIIFSSQRFIQGDYKYEPEVKVKTEWNAFFNWACQQKPFDFTADYENSPCDVDNVTLERTGSDGKGMSIKWNEMLPSFPFNYTTGQLVMRVVPTGI
jgi:hypothetical protein